MIHAAVASRPPPEGAPSRRTESARRKRSRGAEISNELAEAKAEEDYMVIAKSTGRES